MSPQLQPLIDEINVTWLTSKPLEEQLQGHSAAGHHRGRVGADGV
jgi:hypothetical protein